MEKHAFLIIAHKLDFTLSTLLSLLDDKRNDIFIHIDKKTSEVDEATIKSKVTNAGITFVKKRSSVTWMGGYSWLLFGKNSDMTILIEKEHFYGSS